MDSRYKNKAITGVALWFCSIPLVFIAGAICKRIIHEPLTGPSAINEPLFLSFLFVQYVTFFWGGNQLAKAKGYSGGLLAFGIIWPAQLIILPLLMFGMPDKCSQSSNQMRKKSHGRNESQISRIIRYRRNALVANALGVVGILLALFLIFVPLGLFASRDNRYLAGLLIFIPSYVTVMYGCWWWVKAKNWPDAVIFIGLMPLFPLLIPYVRILYLAAGVLPLMMVIMPILMVGVVAVLPDKSGLPKRRRSSRD